MHSDYLNEYLFAKSGIKSVRCSSKNLSQAIKDNKLV